MRFHFDALSFFCNSIGNLLLSNRRSRAGKRTGFIGLRLELGSEIMDLQHGAEIINLSGWFVQRGICDLL